MRFNIGKILGFTLFTGALVLVAKSASGFSRLKDDLKMLQRVTLEGNRVKVYVTLINPTDTSIIVKHPTVTITYKDTVLVASPATDKDYNILAHANTNLNAIELQLNPGSITSIPGMLIEAATGKAKLVSTVVTTIANTLEKKDSQEFEWSLPLLSKRKASSSDAKASITSAINLALKK